MGSHHRRSRRKKSLLPRLSTVALLIVIGVAIWFFKEVYMAKEDVANKEQISMEHALVKRQAAPLIDAINQALCADSIAVDQRASSMKTTIDSTLIARLDTFMVKNNRYAHLSDVIEDEVLLPLNNDTAKANYSDSLVALLDEYNKVEQLSIVDSCLVIAKNLANKNN